MLGIWEYLATQSTTIGSTVLVYCCFVQDTFAMFEDKTVTIAIIIKITIL